MKKYLGGGTLVEKVWEPLLYAICAESYFIQYVGVTQWRVNCPILHRSTTPWLKMEGGLLCLLLVRIPVVTPPIKIFNYKLQNHIENRSNVIIINQFIKCLNKSTAISQSFVPRLLYNNLQSNMSARNRPLLVVTMLTTVRSSSRTGGSCPVRFDTWRRLGDV